MTETVGASTSHKPKGLHGLYRENFTFLPYVCGIQKRSSQHGRRAMSNIVEEVTAKRFAG
jgi:hypothetical protein